ncbi:MAG: hypothetical protein ACI9OU_000409 [Candidatus Promineifilaceae bacterium]|jgi:hypothetical protein
MLIETYLQHPHSGTHDQCITGTREKTLFLFTAWWLALVNQSACVFGDAKEYDDHLAPDSHKKHIEKKHDGREKEEQNSFTRASSEPANDQRKRADCSKDNPYDKKNLYKTCCHKFRERQIKKHSE